MSGAEKVTIVIDGKEASAEAGELLIKVAEEHGTHIPRFCWHPRMNPVGMCRMCLVEMDTPRGRALIPACMQPVSDGMTVHTRSETALKAQEGVLEFLLINHPLDCPVCDKGGECPLQDQTMSYGPGESRFVEEKRHFEKPIPISDLVLLDRERCILCARCTRFSDEISGDPLIEFQGRGSHTQVLTFPDEPFHSYFSGNTVQICPVGALTAVPYRFRARPWDLRVVESTGGFHTEGARIAVHASQNRVLRFLGVDNGAVNQGWLSDKERFGFEYINSPDRLRAPLVRDSGGELREADWGEALDLAAERISRAGGRTAALGGARGTNEDAYALSKFMRTAAGSHHLDCRLGDGLRPELVAGLTGRGRIDDLERAGAILVWGPDLKETHPVLYLRVRRAAGELGARLVIVHPRRTGLDDRAAHKFTYRPGRGAEMLRALRDGEGPLAEARRALEAGPLVVLAGRCGLGEEPGPAEGAAALGRELGGTILLLEHRGNVHGALDMGVSPGLLPGRTAVGDEAAAGLWGGLPEAPGWDAAAMAGAAAAGELEVLLLMGADPVRDLVGADGGALVEGAGFVVSLDLFLNDSSRRADVILPAAAFAEKEGTVTNLEGRVQKVNRLISAPGQAQADWSVLGELASRLGRPLHLDSPQAVAEEIAEQAPAYRGVSWSYLEREAPAGAVVPLEGADQPLRVSPRPAPAPSSANGEGPALHLARTLYDDGIAMRHSPSLRPLAPGAACHLRSDHAASLGVAEGGRVMVRWEGGEAEMPARIDDSLAGGTVYIPFNQPDAPPMGAVAGRGVEVAALPGGGE